MAGRDGAFANLQTVVGTAVQDGVVPGAVILAAREGSTRYFEAFGARQLQPVRLDATRATVYDVASVTKAISTSVLVMRALAKGLLGLEDPVSRHLPAFHGTGKAGVTVRQLLCHASGLPAHRPFYQACGSNPAVARLAILQAAAAEPLIHPPGRTSVYSDLGFMLLGWILERATGATLDVLFRDWIATPLGLASARFVNLQDPGARPRLLAQGPVAPTQLCAARGRMVEGEVDDLNASAMGGVAGHAGLFSDAADLGTVAAALVRAWDDGRSDSPAPGASASGPAPALVDRDIIREFWRPAAIPGSTWRLGWDGPSDHDSQAGTRLDRAAVGHLGFTGCSLWIDPQRALWIVVLANRVHPVARADPRFRAFRADVHDAAVQVLAGGAIGA